MIITAISRTKYCGFRQERKIVNQLAGLITIKAISLIIPIDSASIHPRKLALQLTKTRQWKLFNLNPTSPGHVHMYTVYIHTIAHEHALV